MGTRHGFRKGGMPD